MTREDPTLPSETADAIANAARLVEDEAERRTWIEGVLPSNEDGVARVESRISTFEDDVACYFDDDASDASAAPGDVVDRYTLVSQIGRGGFGEVWAADQNEPVRRRVAIKILKLGMDTRQVVLRFEQERQALALMDHPHVARVLDAGSTPSGRPYFVMELVDGAPIDAYCDRRKANVRERLRIFEQVCRGVQHAHEKGVVHRDLKPSNILVATRDGLPHATVIDFGVAKAARGALGQASLVTAEKQVIGTARYMSPEQAAGSPDVDTRSDVYSLGVVLYELLSGGTPSSSGASGRPPYDEILRRIRDEEPLKPSSRVEAAGPEMKPLAALRGVDRSRLASELKGELDWIAMKALEKDRARRYASADEFGRDVRRHLSGEAVLAAPPSATYRLRSALRRHKAFVAAATAVGIALAVGAVGFAWKAKEAGLERDAARLAGENERAARLRAERSRKKADAVNDFLLDMLAAADHRNLGRETKVVEALDRAAGLVETSFADEPDTEADVRRIVGRTYASLGMFDEATPHVERAATLARELDGPRSFRLARTLSVRAAIARERGRFDAAIADYEAAATMVAALAADPSPTEDEGRPRDKEQEEETIFALRADYANALAAAGRRAEAEAILRAELQKDLASGVESRRTQILTNSLAVLLQTDERLDEAEALYREALAIGVRALGVDSSDTIVARMNLGGALKARGRKAEAAALIEASYADLKRVFGDGHPKTGDAARILGDLRFEEGRMKDALPYYEESVAVRAKIEGEGSPRVAEAKQRLAAVLKRLGSYDRAATLESEALEVLVARDGPESKATLDARLRLANTLAPARRYAEAEAIFRDLLERCPRVLGEDDPTTVVATNSFGVLLMGRGRFAEAEPYVRRALDLGRRSVGPDSPDTLATQHNLAAILRETGAFEESVATARDVVERFEKVLGPKHANLAVARGSLGESLAKVGRIAEAETEFRSAIAIAKGAFGPRNPASAAPVRQLASLLIDDGRAADAEPLLREAVAVFKEARGAEDPRTLAAIVDLGRCLTALRRFDEAATLLAPVYDGLIKAGDDAAREARRAASVLAWLYAEWNRAAPTSERAAAAEAYGAKAAADLPGRSAKTTSGPTRTP
jgi:eukaryotic-like serine/threonine-protein kinase